MQAFNLAGLADNPALKFPFEAQAGLLGTFSLRTCDTMQRLSALHMQMARALVDDTLATCLEVLSCNHPMHMAAAAMRRLQPAGQRLGHYQQQLIDVIGQANAALPSASPAPALSSAPPASEPAADAEPATNQRPVQARATTPPPASPRAANPPPAAAKATNPALAAAKLTRTAAAAAKATNSATASVKAANRAPASAKATKPAAASTKATTPRPAPARAATSPPPAATQPGRRRSPESRKS